MVESEDDVSTSEVDAMRSPSEPISTLIVGSGDTDDAIDRIFERVTGLHVGNHKEHGE